MVLGLTLAGVTTPYGWLVVGVGAAWWIGAMLWKRVPWELQRKPRDLPSGSTPRHEGWVHPEELGRYLDSINQTMQEHGFGRNPNLPPTSEPKAATPSWEELNAARVKRYEENRGLFLVHDWHPSRTEGQSADVVIELCQHGDGPLTRGEIKAVEYTLGPKFSNHSLVCTEAANDFAVEVSMWGPMLCLAKVYLTDGRPPLLLERYINLDHGADPEPQ